MHRYQHFDCRKIDDTLVVQLTEKRLFDAMLVAELQDELLGALNELKPRKVLVDFDGVTQCSTSVINSLIIAKKRLRQRSGDIHLCRLHPTIREAYKLLNLDGTVFHIHDSEAEGLQALADV